MSIQIDSVTLDPPVLLAPLAGITDLPFRQLVARFGAGLVVSEMVASQEVVQAKPAARAKAELGFGDHATSVQLAGRDAYWMAEAARYAEQQGARIIDINMGCPAKRVVAAGGNGACGSALMREPDLALRLIEAVAGAVGIPVTLKMRLGWNHDNLNAPQIAKAAEGAGIRMVTIHGRTRCQFYKGSADWAAIRAVKEAVRIPVIANGDIVDSATAATARSLSGADGVMIGRGAQGRPWLLAQVAAALHGQPAPVVPEGWALADMVVEHYENMLSFYGIDLGVKVARKHLGWYLEAANVPKGDVLTRDIPAEVIRGLRGALSGPRDRAA